MKKRYFAAVAVCVMAMSMFTGCAGNDGKDIGKDAAKTAAFSDAGVTEDEITRLKVSKDHDDGRSIYEVDFTVASTGEEYDYEISAEDGSILQVDKEMDKGSVSTTQNQDQNASENSTQQGSSNTANQTEVAISEEEATNLALERVPGASAQDLRIQLEFDDGVQNTKATLFMTEKNMILKLTPTQEHFWNGVKNGLDKGKDKKMTGLSTLCYIEKDGKYLMLHRTVKKNDVNKDKWIGVGGHFEADESPEECLLREVKEETGYTLTSWKYRAIVTFVSGDGVTEYMSLFTADGFTGEQIACDEGELKWVDKKEIDRLNLWEGDKIFFRLLEESEEFFSLKLIYDGNGKLLKAMLNGKPMN